MTVTPYDYLIFTLPSNFEVKKKGKLMIRSIVL